MDTPAFRSSSPRRWGILFTALLLAGYAFGLPLDAAALAVTRGPYLQLGTQSSIVVRWRTDTATDSRVRYGTSPTDLRSVVDDAASTTEHVVKLTGLNPATQYYYSIGNSTATLAGDDGKHVFVTAPTPGTEQSTHIWVVGDSGTAKSNARAVRNAYLNYKGSRNTHLWLMPGDHAYIDGTDSEYQAALFDMYPTLLRQTVLWPTLGDRGGHIADSASQSGPYYDIFTLPKQGEAGGLASGTEAYYSFDYANIHFVVLDSVETSRAPTGAMLTWLKNDLAATTQPWVIAYWHHSPYSKGSHDFNSKMRLREIRQNVLPILEEAGVDLVLSGHSGSYKRSFLIDGHYVSSGTFDPATMLVDGDDGRIDGDGGYQKSVIEPAPGTVYAVVGSPGENRLRSLDHPVRYVSLKVFGSMVLDVDGPVLDATFLDDTGQVRDHFRMVKTTSTAKASISAANVKATDASPTTLPRNAFLGTYFDNVDFTNQFFTRTDNAINFDWGSSAPASGMGTDYFSTRWEGNWDLAQSGTYRFNVTSNDGVRIWVDNVLILDQWRDQNTSFTKDHLLSAGTHRIKVEHYEGLKTARITVSWLLVGGTQTDTTPPSTPSGLSATAVSSSQVNLSWNASTDNVGVTGYRMERCQGSGCTNFVQIATPTGTTYSGTGLSGNTTYVYRVRAVDAARNLSGYSATASITTQVASTYTVSASPSTVAPGGTITVSYTAPSNHSTTDWVSIFNQGAADTAYNSWKYVPSGTSGTLTLTASNQSGNPLPAGTYEVRYYLNDGFTRAATSNKVTVSSSSDITAPSTPTGLTAAAVSSSQVNLSWNVATDNVGVTGYRIFRCQGTGCTPGTPQIHTVSGTSYSDTGLSPNTTYVYQLKAHDAAGNVSSGSSIASAKTQDSSGSGIPTPTKTAPIVNVKNFGAKGDGVTDDTTTIQNAIDSMTNGGTLEFPAGTYRHARIIDVRKPGVKLWGYGGAVLHATTPEQQAILLNANNTSIYGFKVTSTATSRLYALYHQRIALLKNGHEVVDNYVLGGSTGGVFAYGASNYLVAHNTVERTLADTIHNTHGSNFGRILYNHIIAGGDDGVAVVGYAGDGQPHDMHVEGNVIDGNKARGLAAVGAYNVTFMNNFAQETDAAGLYIASEPSWKSYGNRSIVGKGNTLLRNNKRNMGHGAILIWGGQCGQTYNGVSLDNFDIRIENNRAVAPYYNVQIIQDRPAGCNHNVTMTSNFTSTNPADAGTHRQELLNKGAGHRW